MTPFLAARSARDMAEITFAAVLLFLAVLTAISSLLTIILLIICFCLLPLRALLAVLVTGMSIV